MTSYKNAPMHCLNEVIGQQLSNIASQHQQKKEKQFPPSDAIKTFGGGSVTGKPKCRHRQEIPRFPFQKPKSRKEEEGAANE